MATFHGGTRHPITKDYLDIEHPEAKGMDSGNDGISGSDAIVVLGGLEAEDNTNELLPSNQAKLMALMSEINDLCQWVEV